MTFRIGKCQAPALRSCTAQRDGEFLALEARKTLVKNLIFVLIYYVHAETKQSQKNTEKTRIQ